MKKVIVVGGGAAGMMAAVKASENATVCLIERNDKLGKKLFITGKGRCNVTNACDTQEFFDNCIRNYKFLYSSIYGFDSSKVMEFFEDNGCPLKIERGQRVFPESDHSSDIIRTLERTLMNNGVEILKNTAVRDIIVEDGSCCGIITDKNVMMRADAVILATGGKSYPVTGSDGNMHRVLERHGFNIINMRPGLVPLNIEEHECSDLSGMSLKNVSLELIINNKSIYSGFGEMMFTHFGITGPLVLSASSIYNGKYYGNKARALIDFKPALTMEQLDKRLLRDFEDNKNKQIRNALSSLLLQKLISPVLQRADIDPVKAVNEITREERARLAGVVKGFELTVSGTRDFNEAIITIGGVDVKNINPATMESKTVKNLYMAGEMLDVDGYTGGFNLQIAWSTGNNAGESASI